MKKVALILFLALLIISCNKSSKENPTTETSREQTEKNSTKILDEKPSQTVFNIENIPFSMIDLGAFPYFSFPKGLKSQNKTIEREYDIIYFPIDSIMTPLEGKAFKVNVSLEDRKNDSWSLPFFLKSYDDAILEAGGHKIFDGKISKEEYNRFSKEASYLGESGSIGYTNQTIKTYIIRRKDGKNIYIQLTGNNAGGKLNILQEEGFKQTITKITADDIVKDLAEKGKSILYINFDIDKSDITTDGKEIINQIADALKKDNSVNIAIEGHTDNTGDTSHNKKLSNDRANAVMHALINQKIDKSRLSAKGFGAERPLVSNDSESNKAKTEESN